MSVINRTIAQRIKEGNDYKNISDCIERKNKINIVLSKRLTRNHIFEIELKNNKFEKDFTYLIKEAKNLFYYLYSLEESKEKLNPLFSPCISVVWDGKLTLEDEEDEEYYEGIIFNSLILPTISYNKNFLSEFDYAFSKLLKKDDIVKRNCENISAFIGFHEVEFFTKKR